MRRFWGLVQNEFIKLFCRRGILAVFLLLLIFIIGFYGIGKLGNSTVVAVTDGQSAESLREELVFYKTEKPEGYKSEIELINFMLSNNINPFAGDWRGDAAQQLGEDIRERDSLIAKGTGYTSLLKSIEEDKILIATKNYREYYEKKLLDATLADLSDPERESLIWQYQYALDHDVAKKGNEWKYQVYSGILRAREELSNNKDQEEKGIGVDRERDLLLRDSIDIAKYRIENDIRTVVPNRYTNLVAYESDSSPFWQMLNMSVYSVVVILLAAIIIAGGMVSGEYSTGTIRMLLVNPVKRGKILMAKYAALLFLSAGMLIGYYLLHILAAGLFNGFLDVGARFLFVHSGKICGIPGLLAIFVNYMVQFIPLAVYATLAFCLSALTRNTAVSVGIGAFILFAGDWIASFLHYSLKLDWGKYLLFSNLDFVGLLQGTSSVWLQPTYCFFRAFSTDSSIYFFTPG